MSLKSAFKRSYQQFVTGMAARKSPLLSYYFKYAWTPKAGSSEHFIDEFAQKNGKNAFFFLQIGANNGYQHDPLFKLLQRHPHWHGILVEPQKKVFQTQLKPMYQRYENLSLINAALAPTDGTMPLYKIAFSEERWATGLASFDRKTLENHIESGYIDRQAQKQGIALPQNRADYITTESVDCISFDTILKKNAIQNLDLLLIDTEGFDFEIIKMIDFNTIKPRLIVFEYIHLSEQDLNNCKKYLQTNGYQLHTCGRDVAAVKN